MKFLSKFKNLSRKVVATVAVAAVAATGVVVFNNAHAANLSLNTAKDCDYNAVMYCGAGSVSQLQSNYAHGVSGRNTYYSIQDIYHYFGISSSQISGMSTTAVAGTVTKSGNVYVGNTLVATGATTAGRMNIPGSTQVKYGATTFYKRPPSVSFRSNSLAAYVVMVNGKFQFAILASCGNPVVATPKTPNYSIQKQVRTTVGGYGPWVSAVSNVLPGSRVQYRVIVRSTGQVAARNIKVQDVLPSGVTYDGGLVRNGVAVNATNFFGSKGDTISSLAPGATVIYGFNAIVGKDVTPETCVPKTLTNTGEISSPGLPNENSTANVSEKCTPKPAYSCVSLTASQVSRNDYNFNAKASATNGAQIVSYMYSFGDGKSQTVNSTAGNNSVAHTYAQPGTYNAAVVVTVKTDTNHTVTSPACETTVTVVPAPTAACTNLTLTLGDNREVTAKVTYTTSGGATLSSVAYNFGDGSAVVNTANTTQSHTYAQDGSYTVKATLTFTSGVATQTCQASIGINTPAFACDELNLTKGDNRSVTVTINTSASGGATYDHAVVSWGDSSASTTTSTNTAQHQYGADGTYNITATAFFMVNGKLVSSTGNCATSVTFSTQVCEFNSNLPANSPECVQPCQFNHSIPASSNKCVPPTTPPTTPPVLPNTGAGNVIGLFLGASVIGGLGYRFALARRLARQ